MRPLPSSIRNLVQSATWPMEPRALEEFARHLHERREDEEGGQTRAGPEARLDGAVAVVPIIGPILPREDEAWWYGGTSSNWLRDTFTKLGQDPKITAVVLDVDSPGGVITGVPEAASALFAMRDTKPTVAVSNGMMASAAYWIGSAADQLVSTPSSMTGSIGVWRMHVDASSFFEQLGFKVTLISAGKHKVEGHPFGPLSDETLAHFQAEVDDVHAWFIGDVAKHRAVSKAAVRDGYGEGRIFKGNKAKELGMVDRLDTLEGVLGRLTKKSSSKTGRAAARVADLAEAEQRLAEQGDAA